MYANGGATGVSPRDGIFKQAHTGSKWYQAMERGNCAEVMQLLRADAQLLQKTGCWGRTALHAAVVGGWGDVTVEEVLGMSTSGPMGLAGTQGQIAPQKSVPLQDLLDARDNGHDLTALQMAVIIGSAKVVKTILRASARDVKDDDVRDDKEEMDERWQQRKKKRSMEKQHQMEEKHRQQDEEQQRQRQQLRGILPTIFELFSDLPEYTELLKYHCKQVTEYRNEGEEYVLHSICYTHILLLKDYIDMTYVDDSEPEVKILRSIVKEESEFNNMQSNMISSIVEKATNADPCLAKFLFNLQDNWGMTPLHAAVSSNRFWSNTDSVSKVLELIPDEFVNAPDGAGRTPLHRAAAQTSNNADETLKILLKDTRTQVNACFDPLQSFGGLDDSTAFQLENLLTPIERYPNYRFKLAALHLAILHSYPTRVKLILDHGNVNQESCVRRIGRQVTDVPRSSWMDEPIEFGLTPLNLAVVMGAEATLQVLLKDDKVYDSGRIHNKLKPSYIGCHVCALHIAACCGYTEIVSMILDDKNFDPLVTDGTGHGALHYAADAFMINKANLQSLFHSVDLHYILLLRISQKRMVISEGYSGKRGCINLLLQAGINVWSKGKTGKTPTPGLLALAEDRAWWHEKVDSVTMDAKKNLTDAANAISVTAALVATASFVGPLQPPVGYQNGAMYIDYKLSTINMFIVCDTLSFYFAVATIMLSVIPSLPLLQAPLRHELDRTRKIVIMAVCLLLTSIIFVLLSFAAATIAVLPSHWSHRVSTFSTTMLGGAVCLMVLYVFSLRLVRLVFHENVNIRRSYDGLAKFDWRLLLHSELIKEKVSRFKILVKKRITMMCTH